MTKNSELACIVYTQTNQHTQINTSIQGAGIHSYVEGETMVVSERLLKLMDSYIYTYLVQNLHLQDHCMHPHFLPVPCGSVVVISAQTRKIVTILQCDR